MTWIAILIAALIIAAPLLLLLKRMAHDAPDRDALIRLQAEQQQWQAAQTQLQQAQQELSRLQQVNVRLESDLDHERRQNSEKLKLLEQAETRLKQEFEILANQLFEKYSQNAAEQNKTRLSALLDPFKNQLETFRQRVDEVHRQDTEQAARLVEQVRQLASLSNQVSEDANNLAKAIKGDAKRQGDWGEIIIKRLLEAAGLTDGREFESQVSIHNEDGQSQRPDFMINLPDNKAIIVDAKVSLKAYDDYCRAATDEARATALKAHLQSVAQHQKGLVEKRYEDLLGNRTLDFVIMCIPIEPAFQLALQGDPERLYHDAQLPVVITGPSTLLITLRMIAQIWRRENENRNAEKIADRAGRLVDQIILVYESVSDARNRIDGLTASVDLALNRIQDGRGNLLKRAEDLRTLGAKVSKPLPKVVTDDESTQTLGNDSDNDD